MKERLRQWWTEQHPEEGVTGREVVVYLLALDHFDDLRFRGAMEALDELLDSRCAIRQKTLAAVRRKVDRTAAELTSPLNRRREQYTAARDRHFPAQTAPTERA